MYESTDVGGDYANSGLTIDGVFDKCLETNLVREVGQGFLEGVVFQVKTRSVSLAG